MAAEHCPTCRSELEYNTDTLGRLVGTCRPCRLHYRRSTIAIAPPVLPTSGPERRQRVGAWIEQILRTHPGATFDELLLSTTGTAPSAVRQSLRQLVVTGRVISVEPPRPVTPGRRRGGRVALEYYLADSEPLACA
jgi:hypothetical protein